MENVGPASNTHPRRIYRLSAGTNFNENAPGLRIPGQQSETTQIAGTFFSHRHSGRAGGKENAPGVTHLHAEGFEGEEHEQA
jgi:hypothetical protein